MNDRKRPPQEVLEEAARRYGVGPSDLQLIRHGQNAVYGFEKDGKGFILRLTDNLRKSTEEVAAEIAWIVWLAGREVPVCRHVPSQRGRLMETVSAGNDVFTAAAFERAPGKPIAAEDMAPALYRTFGQLLGRLHAVSKEYRPASSSLRRPDWHEAHGLNRDLDHLPADQGLVRARVRELVQRIRALPTDRDSYGLLHGDMSFANCFLEAGRLHLFDFDHCEYGYFAAEIGTAVYECAIHVPAGGAEKVAKFWPNFWAGYSSENALKPSWLPHIPDFVRLRDAWIYVHFHRVHDMPVLMAREERIRRDFAAWRQRIEQGLGPVDVAFC